MQAIESKIKLFDKLFDPLHKSNLQIWQLAFWRSAFNVLQSWTYEPENPQSRSMIGSVSFGLVPEKIEINEKLFEQNFKKLNFVLGNTFFMQ